MYYLVEKDSLKPGDDESHTVYICEHQVIGTGDGKKDGFCCVIDDETRIWAHGVYKTLTEAKNAINKKFKKPEWKVRFLFEEPREPEDIDLTPAETPSG